MTTTLATPDFMQQIADAHDSTPTDNAEHMTPDMIGMMDAEVGYPFAPEMFYVKHSDKCLYAAGWAEIKGASYLTDGFLLGSEVESIEDDYIFISQGGS